MDKVYCSHTQKWEQIGKVIKFPFNVEKLLEWLVKQTLKHYWLFWVVYKIGIRINISNNTIEINFKQKEK